MGPVWVRWMVTWWESARGSELDVSNGVFPGNLQMKLGELDRVLHGKFDQQ